MITEMVPYQECALCGQPLYRGLEHGRVKEKKKKAKFFCWQHFINLLDGHGRHTKIAKTKRQFIMKGNY